MCEWIHKNHPLLPCDVKSSSFKHVYRSYFPTFHHPSSSNPTHSFILLHTLSHNYLCTCVYFTRVRKWNRMFLNEKTITITSNYPMELLMHIPLVEEIETMNDFPSVWKETQFDQKRDRLMEVLEFVQLH